MPIQLYIDKDGWDKYYGDENYEFEDALTIFWWLYLNIPIDELSLILDNFSQERYNAKGLKTVGNTETNEITAGFNEATNRVEELSCRIDLREIDKPFIDNLFLLAKRYDCLLMDRQGRLFEPNLTDLVSAIKLSNSYRFISNPYGFLDDLSLGIIKPE